MLAISKQNQKLTRLLTLQENQRTLLAQKSNLRLTRNQVSGRFAELARFMALTQPYLPASDVPIVLH